MRAVCSLHFGDGDERLPTTPFTPAKSNAPRRGDVNDRRKLVVVEFRVCFAPEAGAPDVVFDLSTEQGLNHLKVRKLQRCAVTTDAIPG